ncbi:lipoprotein [Thioclava sp. A2]
MRVLLTLTLLAVAACGVDGPPVPPQEVIAAH